VKRKYTELLNVPAEVLSGYRRLPALSGDVELLRVEHDVKWKYTELLNVPAEVLSGYRRLPALSGDVEFGDGVRVKTFRHSLFVGGLAEDSRCLAACLVTCAAGPQTHRKVTIPAEYGHHGQTRATLQYNLLLSG